jgi:hypothetical protein
MISFAKPNSDGQLKHKTALKDAIEAERRARETKLLVRRNPDTLERLDRVAAG